MSVKLYRDSMEREVGMMMEATLTTHQAALETFATAIKTLYTGRWRGAIEGLAHHGRRVRAFKSHHLIQEFITMRKPR